MLQINIFIQFLEILYFIENIQNTHFKANNGTLNLIETEQT